MGDNVGDCAGRGADLFESIAGEILAVRNAWWGGGWGGFVWVFLGFSMGFLGFSMGFLGFSRDFLLFFCEFSMVFIIFFPEVSGDFPFFVRFSGFFLWILFNFRGRRGPVPYCGAELLQREPEDHARCSNSDLPGLESSDVFALVRSLLSWGLDPARRFRGFRHGFGRPRRECCKQVV